MNKVDETLEETPKQTAKERLLEAQEKDVPLDLFLYSCLEQESLLKATAKTGAPELSWTVLVQSDLPENRTYIEETSFGTGVQRLMNWYRDQFPNMASRTPLNHEALSSVVPPIVALDRDLERLHQIKHQGPLPLIDQQEQPVGVWAEVFGSIKAIFPHYERYFSAFIRWSHATEFKEEFEPGSRPPVGRFAPPPLRREGTFGKRGAGVGPERGGVKSSRRTQPERQEQGERSGRASSRDGAKPPEMRGKGQRKQRTSDDRPNRRDRGPARPSESETQRLSDQALAEVDEALNKLRGDTSVETIKLNPTNSFYRRIQHQRIVEAGFVSSSVGEGQERAVQVTRKD